MAERAVDDGFERFWASYPRRCNKVAARKAWGKLAPSPELVEQICAALVWQSRQPAWTKDGGEYVPHASTYLNNERWTDEPPRRTTATLGGPPARVESAWRQTCWQLRHQPPCQYQEFCEHRQRKAGAA